MPVYGHELAVLEELLQGEGASEVSLGSLRKAVPALSLTRCDARDVDGETPFRSYEHCQLYLVDASEHCWRLTDDPRRATGLVIAYQP